MVYFDVLFGYATVLWEVTFKGAMENKDYYY